MGSISQRKMVCQALGRDSGVTAREFGYNSAGIDTHCDERYAAIPSEHLRSDLYLLMADTGKKNRAQDNDDDNDVSFEASDAVPLVTDDIYDEETGRQPINLDADIDLSDAIAKAGRQPAILIAPNNGDAAASPVDIDVDDALETASGDARARPAVTREIEGLKSQLAQANDEKLRALADLQNFRRRGEEERVRIVRDANERLILQLLPVLDDFDLAVSAAKQSESYEQLIGGVEAIQRKLNETLDKQGVDIIPSVGEKFDPDLHEAVMLDEEADAPDETVTFEMRRGYTLNKRVIRPSLVKVAKGG